MKLREATRAAKEGIKLEYAERVKRWINKGCYFHMSSLNKVGINPKSHFNTPLGIYTYPLNENFFDLLINDLLPFAGERQYVHVVRPINEDRLIGSEMDDDVYDKYTNMLEELVKARGLKVNFHNLLARVESTSNIESNAGYFWNLTRQLSMLFGNKKVSTVSNPLQWRNILVNLGIDGFIDDGEAIIHENEPTQAVFFGTYALEHLDTVEWPIKAHTRDLVSIAQNIIAGKVNPNMLDTDELLHMMHRVANYKGGGSLGNLTKTVKFSMNLLSKFLEVLIERLTVENCVKLIMQATWENAKMFNTVLNVNIDDEKKIALLNTFLKISKERYLRFVIEWAISHNDDYFVELIADKNVAIYGLVMSDVKVRRKTLDVLRDPKFGDARKAIMNFYVDSIRRHGIHHKFAQDCVNLFFYNVDDISMRKMFAKELDNIRYAGASLDEFMDIMLFSPRFKEEFKSYLK